MTPLLTRVKRIALGVALACATSNAFATPPDYHREYGYIDTPNGARLAYVAYLPNAAGKHPAVLQYDTYFGGGSDPEPLFLDHGYAFVAVNVPGTGCSHGTLGFLDPPEIRAGADAVEWISRQPWSDGNVGMWGYSYPGHTSLMVAALHPQHLRAVVAGSVTRSFYTDGLYPGGIFNVGLASQWVFAMQPKLEKIGIESRLGWGDAECRRTVDSRVRHHLYDAYASHRLNDSWWQQRSVAAVASRIAVPTMLVHNWQDQLLTSGIEVYPLLRAPKQAFAMTGGHSFGQVQPLVMDATVKWFDRYLKGEANGVENDPKVTVLWEVTSPLTGTATPNWVTTYSDWPATQMRREPFYFGPNGALLRDKPSDAKEGDQYFFPLGTELVGDDKQFALAPDHAGSLSYRTPPLGSDLVILGSPVVNLFVTSKLPRSDFLVVLHDIHPNGDTELIQKGVIRAELNGSAAPVAVRRRAPRDVERVTAVSLTLPPVGAVLRTGHRLELIVLAPSAIPQPSWALPPLSTAGRTSILRSSNHPSNLILPVLPGASAPKPERPCGSMPFQPCRLAPPTARPK